MYSVYVFNNTHITSHFNSVSTAYVLAKVFEVKSRCQALASRCQALARDCGSTTPDLKQTRASIIPLTLCLPCPSPSSPVYTSSSSWGGGQQRPRPRWSWWWGPRAQSPTLDKCKQEKKKQLAPPFVNSCKSSEYWTTFPAVTTSHDVHIPHSHLSCVSNVREYSTFHPMLRWRRH